MRLSRPFAALLAFAALFALPALAAEPQTGAPAPGFSGVDALGIRHALGDYADKTVILEWTNHECPYVKKHYEAENMQRLQARAAEEDTVWLTVVSSAPGKQGYVTPEEAVRLTDERGASPAAVLLDTTGEIGRLYGARTTPHMFVIDAEGALAYQGAIDSIRSTDIADIGDATNYVEAAMDAMADGKPVAEAETAPYGCSIKY